MESFKVGDFVSIKNDFIHGIIRDIKENLAYVEFRTDGGGGCLPFELSELEHEQWCITTDGVFDKKNGLFSMAETGMG